MQEKIFFMDARKKNFGKKKFIFGNFRDSRYKFLAKWNV